MRIPGYNHPRPKEENYLDFEDKLVRGVEDLRIDGLSLMIYGSYVRGDYDPGRSDIDGVLIFPDEVIIDKGNLGRVSKVLHHALTGNDITFQVTVSDIETMRDGRFNTFNGTFEGYFRREARITGEDYRGQIRYALPTMNDQNEVRFNLRKSRSGLLFARHDIAEDYEAFVHKLGKSLDAVSRASKQILFFVDGDLRLNRFSASEDVRKIFPSVDPAPLIKIKELYGNINNLDELRKKPAEALDLWNDSVTFMEEMIKAYLEKFPVD